MANVVLALDVTAETTGARVYRVWTWVRAGREPIVLLRADTLAATEQRAREIVGRAYPGEIVGASGRLEGWRERRRMAARAGG